MIVIYWVYEKNIYFINFLLLGISSCEKEDTAPLILPSNPQQPSNG